MPLEYYLALFQLHIAVIGVVIAGIVALVQLLNAAKPRRNITLLVSQGTLVAYGVLLAGLLVLLAAGSWVSAFPEQTGLMFGFGFVDFFASGAVGFTAVTLMMISLGWFLQLAFKVRGLLDTQAYLRSYVEATSTDDVFAFLRAVYKREGEIPMDPFQPIREYIKDNAFKYYDYGTADGLKHFSRLFDKALASTRERGTNHEEYEYLARYVSESCEELFGIFVKTSSEKRKADTIALLYSKGAALMQGDHDVSHASLLPIVRGLEAIAKRSDEDDELIAALSRIRQLCDVFLDNHKTHDWPHIAGPFDEICLSVSRITETYYLQKNHSLKTVPMVGYTTGEHTTVTDALVAFFTAYRDLGDRHSDATPSYYFEAIEGVIEVLFVRLGDIVSNNQQHIGFNSKYNELASELYGIYGAFGQDALEHDKPELLALVLMNLQRISRPAKTNKLIAERQEICTMFIDLSLKGMTKFGDIPITDDQPLSEFVIDTLHTYVTNEQIATSLEVLKDASVTATTKDGKKLLARIAAA